jgi:hypothetical protein
MQIPAQAGIRWSFYTTDNNIDQRKQSIFGAADYLRFE